MTRSPGPILSPATSEALEVPDLLALVAELAATDLGRSRIGSLEPFTDEEELRTERRRFEQVSLLVGERSLVPPFESSVAELLERLVSGRPPVGGADLVGLAVFLRASRQAAERIGGAEPPAPDLAELAAELPDLSELERRISSALDRRGEVREDASPELAALRGRIRKVRDRLYDQLGDYVGSHRESLSEDTIPMRGGRLVLVLQAGSRGRLAGLTHGRSGSGKSFYFEPFEAVDDNNSLEQAVEDEDAERQRILAELVGAARQALPDLERLADFLGGLDLLQAASRFATVSDGRLAELGAPGELRLVGARHPLLDPRLAELRLAALGQRGHDRPVVPLDLDLLPEARALIVTGPNAGGKTVALKGVGLLVMAHQCGLPIPVAAGSRLPFLERLVATVGDEQDLLADRSTFSGRLLRLKEAWDSAGPASLLLIDELGSGTDPEEGAALSVALLEGLLAKRSLAVVTTHLTQLAAAALEMDGASCAAMEFNPGTGEPTYHLVAGPPGGSEALALARRLGLPREWLDRAEARLGSEHRQLRRLLAEVEAVRQELVEARENLEREAADAEKLRRRLAAEEAALVEERKSVSRRLGAELDAFRRETTERLRGEVERLRRQLEEGRRKALAEEATGRLFGDAPRFESPAPEPAGPLVEGARVRHLALGWEGRLEKLDRGRAEVAVRGKRVRCREEELVTVEGEGDRGRRRVTVDLAGDGAREVASELNLIGQRIEPALEELDRFLDQALLSSRPEVRIVHGHGSGRLRQAVREHLRRHRAVGAVRPGEPNEGGNGATVVRLKGS